jgi:5-methylthioadenosine/S-adenosylhomocysteine deaminase
MTDTGAREIGSACGSITLLPPIQRREHPEAHARQETVTNCHLRAEKVVDWVVPPGNTACGIRVTARLARPGREVRPAAAPGSAAQVAQHRQHPPVIGI